MSAQDREKFIALKARNKELEIKLEGINEVIVQYEANQSAADQKIKALNSIHQDKIRSLMNSIQLLKKENVQLEKLSKEHKRSELISQLQKDVSDQDLIIETIRELCKNRNIQEDSLDSAIVDALNKGPPRIRAPTREELKIEIKKLKGQIDGLKKRKNEGGVLDNQGEGNKNMLNETMNQEKDESKHNQSINTQLDEAADSNDNLIRRLAELKNENDKLKLELIAETQNIERYEEQLIQKSEELNEVRSAKIDFIILSKKYEALQVEFEKLKDDNNKKFINTYDKELKLEEMEIVAKTQQDKIKMQEQNLQLEIDSMSAKLEDVMQRHDQTKREYDEIKQKYETLYAINKKEEQKNKELNSKFNAITQEHEKLQLKYQTETKSLTKSIESLESKYRKATEDIYSLQTQNENLQEQINTLTIQVDEYKSKVISGQGLKFEGQNWAFGRGGQDLPAETKELRDKIRELTIREIDLQDQLETLKIENRFKQQKELAQSILIKKDPTKRLGNLEIEKIKRESINSARLEYEGRLTSLRLKVKELQDRNNQLQDLRTIIAKDSIVPDIKGDISSLKSLERHKENISENSNISDVNIIEDKIAQGENRELKKKFQEMLKRQADLQKQIDFYNKERQEGKRPSSAQNNLNDQKLKEMQTKYQKEIKELQKRIIELELKEINLSQVSSNVSAMLNSSDQQPDQRVLDNMSSNVQLSLSDLDYKQMKGYKKPTQKEYNINDMDSNVSLMVSKQDAREDLDSISSGISNLDFKKRSKPNDNNIFSKKDIKPADNNIFTKKGDSQQKINSIKNVKPTFSKMNSDIESIVGNGNQNDNISISSGISGLSKLGGNNIKEPQNFRIRKDSQQSVNSSISNILQNSRAGSNAQLSNNNQQEQNLDDISSNIDDLDKDF